MFVYAIAAIVSVRVAAACSCAPPLPPRPGTQPALRVPSLKGNDAAVFVAAVQNVYPKDFSDYEQRWRNKYHGGLSEDAPPPVDRLRTFILQLWPSVFSARGIQRIRAATTTDDLTSAILPFWLTPRRIRLKVEEAFAGPKEGGFVLYTGLAGGDCGVDFKVGERWLIDAYRDDTGRWIAHQCSVTIPVSKADAVLAKLRSERR